MCISDRLMYELVRLFLSTVYAMQIKLSAHIQENDRWDAKVRGYRTNREQISQGSSARSTPRDPIRQIVILLYKFSFSIITPG